MSDIYQLLENSPKSTTGNDQSKLISSNAVSGETENRLSTIAGNAINLLKLFFVGNGLEELEVSDSDNDGRITEISDESPTSDNGYTVNRDEIKLGNAHESPY